MSKRLDQAIVERNLATTRSQAKQLIDQKQMSISELIIRIGDIRSELKQLNNISRSKKSFFDKEEDDIPQLTVVQLNHLFIEKLEKEKDYFDSILQSINWKIELIDSTDYDTLVNKSVKYLFFEKVDPDN